MSWRSAETYWKMKNRMAGSEAMIEEEEVDQEEPETQEDFGLTDEAKEVYAVLDKIGKPKSKAKEKPKPRVRTKRRGGKRRVYNDPLVDRLPDRFFDENGELNLSLVSGAEAVGVLNKQLFRMGMNPIPVIRNR